MHYKHIATAFIAALAIPTSAIVYCSGEGPDGCTIEAHYIAEYNETEWDMECPDGFRYHGRMGGNQEEALCGA